MDRRSCVKSLPEKVPMSVQRALLWGGLLLMVGSANDFRSDQLQTASPDAQ